MDNEIIYMDNAATTAVRPEVVEAMLPYYTQQYGNPSSLYGLAKASQEAEDAARRIIADSIGADPKEIYFTAGGTEADNWALIGAAEAYQKKGKHIITSAVEHPAVRNTCAYLEQHGYEVTYVGVDESGFIRMDELRSAIRDDTILITVMYANNEVGTIEPIEEIGQLAKEKGIVFHTDAVQAYCQVPINVDKDHIDMMSASAHKIYGPKGIGFLYIRKGIKVRSFIHGGDQERRRRAGTENVPAIVGFGKAVEIGMATMQERAAKERELRDYLIQRVSDEVPYARLNGPKEPRLPGNVNFSFEFVEGESLLLRLDRKGICVSTGSACSSTSLEPSHVLLAMGVPVEVAHGSIRITLNAENTKEQVDYVVDAIRDIVQQTRDMSPFYDDFLTEQKKKAQQETQN